MAVRALIETGVSARTDRRLWQSMCWAYRICMREASCSGMFVFAFSWPCLVINDLFSNRTMILELGDTTMCKNEATGMSCAVEFKTKVIPVWTISRTCYNVCSGTRDGWAANTIY